MKKENRGHRPPTGQLLWFLFGSTAVILAVIVLYRHLMGIEHIESVRMFGGIILLGSLIGMVACFALAVPDMYAVGWLNRYFKWGKKTILRVCIQFVLTGVIAVAVSILLTLLSELVFGYVYPLTDVLLRHGMIFSAVNIPLMAVLDRWMFFRRRMYYRKQAELPATNFMDVQQYVLDTFARRVVTVAQGLRFVKSCIFLQPEGRSGAIALHDTIPEEVYEALIPPFALLTVLENAINYNTADVDRPLHIDLSYANGCIEVRNNVQTPLSEQPSTGSEPDLLKKCYGQLSDMLPVSEHRGDVYVVKLPLIREE